MSGLAPWKRWAIGGCAVVLALLGAFSAGRFSSPAVVATSIVVLTAKVETVKFVEKKIYLKAKAEKVTTDKTTDPKTGLVIEHTVKTVDTNVSIADNKDRASTLTENTSSASTKTVTNLPRWRVSLGVGASLAKPLLPIAGPLVLTVEGDYRIYGGLSAGVWVNTVGAAGVAVSMEF